MFKNTFFLFAFLLVSLVRANDVIVGAARLDQYLPLLKGKSVGLVVNQTSMVGNTHLVDTLLSLGIHVQRVFAPEHGFRGTADADEKISNTVDPVTKVSIASLYGDHRKPTPDEMKDLDVLIFDIQDVGVRFYTYISTLHYLMEACAEQKKPLIVLDRPNPNGHYVDGPVLEKQYSSFVGMDPVPIVHGMTVGEYAKMLNGQKWLKNKEQCKLTVIPCLNYDHKTFYSLPVKPSPNLPNMTAIYLYPSLCFFERCKNMSVGRGTDKQFQLYGSDVFPDSLFSFYIESKPGATNPPLLEKKCHGYDLSSIPLETLRQQKFTLQYLIKAYELFPKKEIFFFDSFANFAGYANMTDQIKMGMSETLIRKSWQPALNKFKAIRKKYLLYKDFE